MIFLFFSFFLFGRAYMHDGCIRYVIFRYSLRKSVKMSMWFVLFFGALEGFTPAPNYVACERLEWHFVCLLLLLDWWSIDQSGVRFSIIFFHFFIFFSCRKA